MAENSWEAGLRSGGWNAPSVGPVTEHATIGASIVIKGEVSGREALFVDGRVEGSILFPEHRVTVGRASQVTANVTAKDVVVMGSVKGNIYCSDLLDVRAESCIQGDIVTRRIRIDDGAVLKGSVEIQPSAKSTKTPEPLMPAPVAGEASKPDASVAAVAEPVKSSAVAASAAAVSAAKRVLGSSVLLKPVH